MLIRLHDNTPIYGIQASALYIDVVVAHVSYIENKNEHSS